MGDNKYTLEVTKAQAQAISTACEILARAGIGQWRDAIDALPLKITNYDNWHDDLAFIGKLLARHMKGNIDGISSGFSIHSDEVKEEARTAWDIYQVVRHRISWDDAIADGLVDSDDQQARKWPEMMQVFYDEPLRLSEEPLVKITKMKSS